MSKDHPLLLSVPMVGPLVDCQPLSNLLLLAEMTDVLSPDEKRFAIHKAHDTVRRLKEAVKSADERLKRLAAEENDE